MMTRCLWNNPERADYALYQGRGITVCDRWREFTDFLADMGPKPSLRHTLDRIDSDGNYEPGNCRWATPQEQARNWKTRNRKLECRGELLTIGEWAKRIGIARESLRDRLESGWTVEQAITTPPVRKRERDKKGIFQAHLY